MDIATALRAELGQAVVEPLRTLGLDDVADLAAARFDELAQSLAASLTSDDEDSVAAAGAMLTFLTRHPRPLGWWSTPLGAALAAHTSAEISPTEAGELLGLTRVRIYQLLKEEQLARGPGGGVALRSIARFRAVRRSRNGDP